MVPNTAPDQLIEKYDVVLLDAYGVLLNQRSALPGAAAFINRLKRSSRPFYILTNDASKSPLTAANRYGEMGLDVTPQHIITSGSLLTPYFARKHLEGARCAVLGTGDSLGYAKAAGGRIVAPGEGFDVLIICDESGFDFPDTADAVLSQLLRQLERRQEMHLVLPNPDLIYPKGPDVYGFAAGSIAAMFEGAIRLRFPDRAPMSFTRLGKPFPHLFQEAYARSKTKNMVMLGDQLETDIKGANAFGIDSVLMTTGISGPVKSTLPEALKPTYCLPGLG
jgi:HAD superfamily hydrolase (TIGR01450 family)